MWASKFFNSKTCHRRFIFLYRKIPNGGSLLDEEVSSQSTKKELLVFIKRWILIQKYCYRLSDLVEELQQFYEMYCASESIRDNKEMTYFLQEDFKECICFTPSLGNLWKPDHSSCMWNESRRFCHRIYHWSWTAW